MSPTEGQSSNLDSVGIPMISYLRFDGLHSDPIISFSDVRNHGGWATSEERHRCFRHYLRLAPKERWPAAVDWRAPEIRREP